MRKPVIYPNEYVHQHEEQRDKLLRYMTTKRGRSAVDDFTAHNFKHEAALSLKANNLDARIAVGLAAHKVLSKKKYKFEHPHMLSICPARFAVQVFDAPTYDLNKLLSWGETQLKGLDHITMIDFAYFSNFSPVPFGQLGCVHPHLHSLIWDDAAGTDHMKEIAEQEDALIRGRGTAHGRGLKASEVPGRGLYLFKAPLSEYRAIAEVMEEGDPKTGELFKVPTGKYSQKKRALRPAGAAMMSRILSRWDIPSLAFASGRGIPILKEIMQKAPKIVDKRKPIPKRDYFADI